jgi:pyruvate dehydrogenase E1 component beta subunit
MRTLTYAQAIREAHAQLLALDARVFVIGQGLWSPWYAGASLEGLDREFGCARIVDTPVSENAVTGLALGAALAGLRPIVFHPRMDFMLLAMDPIVNQAANWSYLFGGQAGDRGAAPLVIRAAINRGGEQGAQHSQALHAMFMHVPGLKVVMPSTPADAKGLLMAALADPGPVLYIDDRWLYAERGEVSAEPFTIPIGEVIDLRSLKPWDKEMVAASVTRTGRAVVADGGWRTAGASAEIAAEIAERCFADLAAPVARVTLPDAPAPASRAEEQAYYPGAGQIAAAARELLQRSADRRAKRAAA